MKLTKKHITYLNLILDICVNTASRALSKSLRTAAIIKITNTMARNVCKVTEKLNEDEGEKVASLLSLDGTGNGKVLFMVDLKDAFMLKDLYLRDPVGKTESYDIYVESTIQELGNILSGAICNSIAADLDLTILPRPPKVTCDYAGAIFSAMIMDDLFENDELFIMETTFEIMHHHLDCYFYLIPGTKVIEKLM